MLLKKAPKHPLLFWNSFAVVTDPYLLKFALKLPAKEGISPVHKIFTFPNYANEMNKERADYPSVLMTKIHDKNVNRLRPVGHIINLWSLYILSICKSAWFVDVLVLDDHIWNMVIFNQSIKIPTHLRHFRPHHLPRRGSLDPSLDYEA